MNAIANPRGHAQVESQVETACTLAEQRIALVIPSYQRPYVWPSDDVLKLLDDIAAAFDAKEPHYYIGTVLTAGIHHNDKDNPARTTYELIDGQQRMTTLMLLSLAFREFLANTNPLVQLVTLGQQPRLIFAVRDQVQELLGYRAKLDDFHSPGEDAINDNPYLKHINSALVAATSRLKLFQNDEKKGSEYLEELSGFLFNQVKWVNNCMPDGMDLNRLFATMNTSGVQLEQTDILKSQLLKKIQGDKTSYDAIWQACENLSNYYERNLRKLFPKADWNNLHYSELAQYCPERFPLQNNDNQSDNETSARSLTIAQLAKDKEFDPEERPTDSKNKARDDNNGNGDAEKVYCRSIISFGLLLMHTYRIYRGHSDQADIDVRLNEKHMSESFAGFVESATETEAKAFIECLWQVRYQFDRWVIKWVEEEDEETEFLRLSRISRSQSSGNYWFNRSTRETSDLSQLQSVRLFTGERSAQYWLTPFLGKLVKAAPTDISDVIRRLEDIDNQLSLAQATQKEASYKLLTQGTTGTTSIEHICNELRKPKGTGFEHYWFQKVEYILWRNRDQQPCFDGKTGLQNFRIASRNSVEHVHPQNEEHSNSLEHQYLDSFGNLALLSPGENSSYSNQTVLKKQADFRSKPIYDSLKLAHIFHSITHPDDWHKETIQNHQNDMLDLLKKHYGVDL